jgi:hypothetical protein
MFERPSMRSALLASLLCAAPAWAQGPVDVPAPPQAKCLECGVIRSLRPVTKESAVAADSAKPSGLVATVPLGGGGKPQIGSSTKVGRDVVESVTTWEVIVRLDDGRFTIVTLDEQGDWREGDKVRVERGKIERRTD